MMSVRAFFCLPLPNGITDAAAAWLDRAESTLQSAGLRPPRRVSRGNLHITLRFLGEIDEPTVRRLKSSAAAALPPLLSAVGPVGLSELGTFGRPPRVLFAKLAGATEPVFALHAAIAHLCREAGLPAENERFSPHLTLARFPNPHTAADLLAHLPLWQPPQRTWRPDRVVLMQSVLLPAGPRYTPLAMWRAQ